MKNRTLLGIALAIMGWLWASPVLPCGGGFGMGLRVSAAQDIVVSYKAGVETYQFSPQFCGQSAKFGFVLPVPQALSSTPTLGAATTVSDLQGIAAPTLQYVCPLNGAGNYGGSSGGAASGVDSGSGPIVQVIEKGQVGIFDYSVIKADTPSAFTDWLNANQYPYSSESSAQFAYYVSAGWYFVAFKVTADSENPPSGTQLCGNLGPIKLAFPASTAVIPARIAAATSAGDDAGAYASSGSSNSYLNDTYLSWTIYYIGTHEVSLFQGDAGANVPATVQFSGQVSADEITAYPAGGVAAAGDWFTELNVVFDPAQLTSDLTFQSNPTDVAYRPVVWEYSYAACSESLGSEPVEPAEAGAPAVDASLASYDGSYWVYLPPEQSDESAASVSGSSCSLSPTGASSSPGLPLGLGAMLGVVVISARRRGRSICNPRGRVRR